MNELTATTGFKVMYTPSQIAIEGEVELNQLVEKTINHYNSLVFTDQNVAEAMEARKDLNALIGALDAQRKDVKREYSKPLVEFEAKLKSLVGKVTAVSDEINKGIKEFDEKQRLIRQENLITEITRMATAADVDPDKIEIAPSWLNKGSFTGTGNLVKKIKEEIQSAIEAVLKERERIESDKTIIEAFAKARGLEPDGYVAQINKGATAAELFPVIEAAVKRKAEREEEERKKAEYDAAMEQLEKDRMKEHAGSLVDLDTGEIVAETQEEIVSQSVDTFPEPYTTPMQEDTITFTLRLTGPVSKMKNLKQYILDSGIMAEPIAE